MLKLYNLIYLIDEDKVIVKYLFKWIKLKIWTLKD